MSNNSEYNQEEIHSISQETPDITAIGSMLAASNTFAIEQGAHGVWKMIGSLQRQLEDVENLYNGQKLVTDMVSDNLGAAAVSGYREPSKMFDEHLVNLQMLTAAMLGEAAALHAVATGEMTAIQTD